jgi:uncharacterized repeat protein (TIGR02543 family)
MVSVGISGRRSQERGPARQNVRCGVRGTACLSEVSPGDRMTMRAIPASGYVFAGWTSGCTGGSTTCTFSPTGPTGGTAPVTARFIPRRSARTLAINVRPPKIKARFVQSNGRGTLKVNGSVSLTARLKIRLSRPGGGPLLLRNIRAVGPFGFRAVLRKGTLAGGARLFPGAFVVSVTGRAGSIPVPLQMRTIFLRAPREGVVRRSYASTTENGSPMRTLPRGPKEAWAIFRFATQPIAKPIVAYWYDRSGNLIGTAVKNNRPVIATGIGSSTVIPSGTWRVDLKAGGRLVKRLKIRIG